MDLREFYRNIRDVERQIADQYPLVTSLKTEDGGKEGIVAEVPRYQAARMIVEGKARLATDAERKDHHDKLAAVLKANEEWETARRLHLAMSLPPELRQALTKPKQSTK